MRRLIFRPLALVLTFTTGLFVTFLLTFAGDVLSRLIDEPSNSIPALCRSESSGGATFCSQRGALESEEASVYSALVEQMSIEDRGRLIVVQDQTVSTYGFPMIPLEERPPDRLFETLRLDFPFAERETLDSFLAHNEQSHPMNNPFLLRTESRLISQREIEGFSRAPGVWWATFYRNHRGANGFLTLSKVGFNREANEALVYRAFACGDTCGYGSFVFLVKEGGIWRIRAVAEQWVS